MGTNSNKSHEMRRGSWEIHLWDASNSYYRSTNSWNPNFKKWKVFRTTLRLTLCTYTAEMLLRTKHIKYHQALGISKFAMHWPYILNLGHSCVFQTASLNHSTQQSSVLLDVPVPIHWVHTYANASACIRGMERVLTRELVRMCLRKVLCWMVMCLVNDVKSAYVTLPAQHKSTLLPLLPMHAYADCKISGQQPTQLRQEFPRIHNVGHSKKTCSLVSGAKERSHDPAILELPL